MNLKDLARKALSTFALGMLCVVALAQGQTVAGVVTDDFGDPMIGVNVSVKGTTNGSITDFDGNYVLHNVNPTDVLVFSYIGYTSKEATVGQQAKIDMQMMEDQTALEEVVVVGYGTMKKKDLTGSVATVNSEALTAIPVANASEALQGKMAGVQITTTEGSPDADVSIRVRGGGSITQSNEPLYIVDGFPVESISNIPSSDIEDITVLKDASSTAIYGSRGANGVILVTTKSGKEGKVNVSYNAYYSWKKIANTLPVLGAYDYANWQYELAALRGHKEHYTDFFGSYDDMGLYRGIATNDWQDQTFGRTGETFNHNLSITGGSDVLKYSFSYAHMNDKAIMLNSGFQRDNIAIKMQHNIGKKVKLDYQVRWTKTNINGGGANEQSSSYNTDKRLRYAVQFIPFPVEGISGTADDDATDPQANFYNPVVSVYDNDMKRVRHQLNMSAALQWEVYKDLKLKTEIGYDTYIQNTDKFLGSTTYYVKNVFLTEYDKDGNETFNSSGMPAAEMQRLNRNKLRSTNTASYDFKEVFGKNSKHHLDVLVGQEYIFGKQQALTDMVLGFPSWFTSDFAWKFSAQGHPLSSENFYSPNDILSSYFGRFNYNWGGKYYVSATFRADGSSKFADGNRWGFFPSASLAWRLSDEAIFDDTKDWLDDLKLRFSYGTAGNNNIPSGVSATQDYESKPTTWVNGVSSYWAPSKTMSNPDLTWETTYTRNLGLDYSFFNGRINGNIEAYLNNTTDLLIQYPTAGTGYDYQYRNMGETENKGFEFSLNGVAVQKKNFDFTVGFNVSINKNNVKSLGELKSIDNIATNWASTEIDRDYIIAVNQPIGQIFGYESDGRYEVSDFNIEASKAAGKWILNEGVIDGTTAINTAVRPGSMKLKSTTQHWDASQGKWINNETGEVADGKISAEDRKIIGDTNPKLIGGLNLNARIYWFDIAANFVFSVGNDVYNANGIEYTTTSKYKYRNLIKDMEIGKRWTNINSKGELLDWNSADELAALNATTTKYSPYTEKYVLTSDYVEDASFLRLATLTVGYTLPKQYLTKLHLSNLRVYATGYNLFCLTNYSGMDPEVSAVRKTNMTPGCDYSAYPKSRQFVVGVNVNF